MPHHRTKPITNNPPRYAVMGNPIAHSLSPYIHAAFARQAGVQLIYEALCIEPDSLASGIADFFATGGLGLNITAPFKEAAFAQASVRTPRCQLAGAANTLWWQAGQLHADNTDGAGLVADISRHRTLKGLQVLLLGAGGAARGIIEPLFEAGIAGLTCVNRTVQRAYDLQKTFPRLRVEKEMAHAMRYDLIVHATSAGQNLTQPAWDSRCLHPLTLAYDLFYNRTQPTAFVRWAKESGCEAMDGLGMLVEQAAEAFWRWHGVQPDTAAVLKQLRECK